MGQYLLKFFEKEDFQNDFLNGKLYMNTLKYFRENEFSDIARTDKFEAIKTHMKPDLIQIGTMNISKDECGITTINTTKYDTWNILCLYALWKEIEDENILVDEKNKDFGHYCVCIINVKEFLSRIDKVLVEKNVDCEYMKVNYINKNKEYKIKDEEVPFTKFDNFSYQKEFRIVIDTKNNRDEHYIMEIGDLRDIAFITTIDKINKDIISHFPSGNADN